MDTATVETKNANAHNASRVRKSRRTGRVFALVYFELSVGIRRFRAENMMPFSPATHKMHFEHGSCKKFTAKTRRQESGVVWAWLKEDILRYSPLDQEVNMRMSRGLVVFAVILLCFAAVAQAKPNFTGEWKLNPAKSDFGMMPAPTSSTANVTHSEPSLKVTMKSVSERGEFTSNNAYTTDGKECVNQGRMGEMKSTLKWDGDTLVIESKAEFGGNPVTITDKWTLSEDGKTLTISRHFASSQGEGDAKQVYEKQ